MSEPILPKTKSSISGQILDAEFKMLFIKLKYISTGENFKFRWFEYKRLHIYENVSSSHLMAITNKILKVCNNYIKI